MRNLILWLFNTAAKLLKYLPSYGLQTHTFKDAKFQTVLQNGFKDFTVLPKSWKKKNLQGKITA